MGYWYDLLKERKLRILPQTHWTNLKISEFHMFLILQPQILNAISADKRI